ncbi:glycoside hydrolase family 28 protein [Athelia psychrophila]|uniref:Glycoside hydrolase family 28 protein n=1 Tax=Athelia psychrophila TaxID=1759441 RepID=A0A166DLC4_9AGAM|nr:glycoside hydrolase family 28 protein [Fibularhizoctonia sp. CBS 109695]
MFISASRVALSLLLASPLVLAQLSGTVGPTTTHAEKRTTICNVLDYGGVIGSSDIGPAIGSAFTNCVKLHAGSTLYVPPGNYDMATWQTLDDGTNWAFQLDGYITRTSTTGGHMIIIENANDFEFYSSTSAGTIQGLGYQCRNAGPRLMRIVTSTNWSLHDIIFVDSPEFHLVVQGGSNGEIYNLAIRGADIGGSDGIDISGTNHWVHDVEVTNRDECVTVKSPASDFLIENIWCNQSGGSAIGSLAAGTAIENIVYKNIYTNGGNQIFMIKSNGGDGYVKNVLLENFKATGSAYGLDIDQYWSSQTAASGVGVSLTNIQIENWNGLVVDGVRRPPYRIVCSDTAPCSDITISDVWLWSATGLAVTDCESAFGTGECLRSGSTSSYAATTTSYTKPASYTTLSTMSGDLTAGFTSTASIAAPTIPTTFYPGVAQISPLAKNGVVLARATPRP